MQPKLRTTILCMCAALLLAVLAMPQMAEAQGYNVRRGTAVMQVAQYADNAAVNNLTFMRADSGDDNNISDAGAGETLTITIGYGLLITNDDEARGDTKTDFTLWCDNNNSDDDGYEEDCQAVTETGSENPSAKLSNKGGAGTIEITIGSMAQSFVVAGVRVDASALAVKDQIMVSISSSTTADSVPLDGTTAVGGVSGVVGEVADSLKVTAAKDADLACSSDAPAPSITVAEGFSMAWGPTNLNAHSGGADTMSTASVKIVLTGLPDGAKVEWPEKRESMEEVTLADAAKTKKKIVNGTLTLNSADSSSSGSIVVYDYKRVDTYETGTTDDNKTQDLDESIGKLSAKRSFEISPSKTTFMGDASIDITAMLHPMARRGTDGEKLNLDSELSFEHPAEAPEKGNGDDWLVISECVTYLLYPFITCGATPGWSTGISVSNTTADGNIFGAFDEVTEQMGSVVMYGFPRGQAAPAEGESVQPVVSTISSNLMAGDTITLDCGNTTMAGMEGYAIIRAGFQHARGMAFVLGNFADGAGVDVSHGYMAEVIDDPLARDADPTDAR